MLVIQSAFWEKAAITATALLSPVSSAACQQVPHPGIGIVVPLGTGRPNPGIGSHGVFVPRKDVLNHLVVIEVVERCFTFSEACRNPFRQKLMRRLECRTTGTNAGSYPFGRFASAWRACINACRASAFNCSLPISLWCPA